MKTLDTGYIYKSFDFWFDDLKKVAINLSGSEQSIKHGDYVRLVKKTDAKIVDINNKKNEVEQLLNKLESDLLDNPDTEKNTLKIFDGLRENYENGINDCIESLYREKLSVLEYKQIESKIKQSKLSGDKELEDLVARDLDKKIPEIEKFIKEIDDIVSTQGDESTLGFASYTKQELSYLVNYINTAKIQS
jgi:hypothetical protein